MSRNAPKEYGLVLAGFVFGRRLHYRWRHGTWCRHPTWSRWQLMDLGRFRMRWCSACGHPDRG